MDKVVWHAGLSQEHVHVTRHPAGNRVYGELHVDAGSLQEFDELVQLLLGLSGGEAIARSDDDTAGVAHRDGGRPVIEPCCSSATSPKLLNSTLLTERFTPSP